MTRYQTSTERAVEQLTEFLGIQTKAVASTPTASYGHGPGGLFSNPALEKPLFSTLMLPYNSLMTRLPWFPTTIVNGTYGILTGQTATSGNEPTTACGDFPVVGKTKLCMSTKSLARQGRASQVYDISRIGEVDSRGEHFDFQIVNGSNTSLPSFTGNNGRANLAQTEYAKAVYELGVAMVRDFAQEVYTGNPANNTDGRQYYRGLDKLINTGYRDVVSGIACPAADSIVHSFNNTVNTAGGTMVRTMTDIMRRLKFLAGKVGLNPVEWAWVMTPGLFYALTEIWPCAYSTYRCQSANTFSASQVQFNDGQRQIEMRDEMRADMTTYTGQFLWIDGTKVPVLIDDAIPELSINNTPQFRSSMYLVPIRSLGQPLTYWEYFDYSNTLNAGSGVEFANSLAAGNANFFSYSDGGRYLVINKPPTNTCIQIQALTRPALILRTPFLAARITNIDYTLLDHERSAFPDSPYFANGGMTNYNGYGPSYYTPTA